MKSYKDLEIYQLAYQLALELHEMIMQLSNYELYKQGSQVRKSTKSIKDNIAEGYGRRRYKAEFIRFLIFSHASCDEALSQLNMISDIHFKIKPLTSLIKDMIIWEPRSINLFNTLKLAGNRDSLFQVSSFKTDMRY